MFDPKNSETYTSPTNSKIVTALINFVCHELIILSFYVVATIKYWGKNDVKLNTPMNSSVSVTLDQVTLIYINFIQSPINFSYIIGGFTYYHNCCSK